MAEGAAAGITVVGTPIGDGELNADGILFGKNVVCWFLGDIVGATDDIGVRGGEGIQECMLAGLGVVGNAEGDGVSVFDGIFVEGEGVGILDGILLGSSVVGESAGEGECVFDGK